MTDKLHVVCPHCRQTNGVPAERLTESPRCGGCGKPLFHGAPTEVDAAGLEKHLARDSLPVVVDFWAPWCGPCRQMAPAFAAAAAALEPGVRLLKLNTDEAQAVSSRLGIRSIPTLIAFREGREIARQSGAMPAGALTDWVRRQL